ncbi:hypothetical protein M9H77_19834 [Catharanthus roseus]|uniref:Uncharacterized protein n=1 Tax=Catharanthus roseus TaxID=4058 RepID=A0ACC0BBH3_CATRO|nr:hypothetical protein M9H77_19834 [Catharanthus roseus]
MSDRRWGPGKHTQAILAKIFSKSKELEERHKHRSEEKQGEYERFHEMKRRVEEEAGAMGAIVLDNLYLMATIAGGISCGCIYRARSEEVHLRDESSHAPSCRELALIKPFSADMLHRIKAAVSSISDAFNYYMRRFLEQNPLVYIPPLLMMDLIKATMHTSATTSSPPFFPFQPTSSENFHR